MGAKLVRGKRERERVKRRCKKSRDNGKSVPSSSCLPARSVADRLIMQTREMLAAFLGCSFSRGFSAEKGTKVCEGKVCQRGDNNEKSPMQ